MWLCPRADEPDGLGWLCPASGFTGVSLWLPGPLPRALLHVRRRRLPVVLHRVLRGPRAAPVQQHELLPVSRRAPRTGSRPGHWRLADWEPGPGARIILRGPVLEVLVHPYSSTRMYGQAQGMREEDPSPPELSQFWAWHGSPRKRSVFPKHRPSRPWGGAARGLRRFQPARAISMGRVGSQESHRMTGTLLPRCLAQVLLRGVSGGAGGRGHGGRGQAAGALELLHVSPAALPRHPAAPQGLECASAGLLHQRPRARICKPGIRPSLSNKAPLSKGASVSGWRPRRLWGSSLPSFLAWVFKGLLKK